MAIKKPFIVKESQPIRSAHDFSQNREEWEWSVFQNAAYFTVIVFTEAGRFRGEFSSLRAALDKANEIQYRKLVYAVTAAGRYVLLPEPRWEEYLEDWTRRNNEGERSE